MISFKMLLDRVLTHSVSKPRSTVAVVSGSTEINPASLDKLGKACAAAMSLWPISFDRTWYTACTPCKNEPPE